MQGCRHEHEVDKSHLSIVDISRMHSGSTLYSTSLSFIVRDERAADQEGPTKIARSVLFNAVHRKANTGNPVQNAQVSGTIGLLRLK